MSKQFSLPDLGEGVKEGLVLRLLVQEGDHVEEDQLLMEVETDKAAVEIPSPYAGVITKLHVEESQVVNVGDTMVTYDGAEAPAPATTSTATASVGATAVAPPPAATTTTTLPPRKPASPAVRKLARTLGVDIANVNGSGPGGRVLRRDVETAASATSCAPAAPTLAPAPAAPLAVPVMPVPTAPSNAQSTAQSTAAPSFAPLVHVPAVVPPPAPRTQPLGVVPDGRDETDTFGAVRRVPVTAPRRAIASIMTHAMATIPHVTDTDDVDVTDLDRMRREHNAASPAEAKLGMLPFIIRAVVRALQAYPIFNASLDPERDEIVYRRYINIAIGVQTERGLTAPVLRDVDRLTIPHINAELARLADRARQGTLGLDEMSGGTYTISNAGAMGGSRYSTPIITPPQVAVLALGRTRRMPWVVNDEVAPRLIMPLSHSMDHRLIDGAIEIAFMQHLIQDLEKPVRLML